MPTIRLQNVSKSYQDHASEVPAIRNIDLSIEQGEFVFFVGSRGAGKSTLMEVISGRFRPNSGSVFIDDTDIAKLSRRSREKVCSCMGCLPRSAALDRSRTVLDNLAVYRKIYFVNRRILNETSAQKALSLVGLPDAGKLYPVDLSVSECRRVLVAKAILNSPSILLLDDFTSQMDDDTVWDMLHLVMEMNRLGTTVIIATNSSYIVNVMRRRVVTLADGKIVGDVKKGRYGYIG